jgi:hypothetical protein
LPLSSHIVAVMFADDVDRFVRATPIRKPALRRNSTGSAF